MNGKDRIKAALSVDGTSEIPAVICYERIFIRDHWRALTGRPVWHSHEPDVDMQLACFWDIIDKIGQDWVRVYPFYSAEERKNLSVELHADNAFIVNRRTKTTTRLDEVGFGRWNETPDYLVEEEGCADLSRSLLNESGAKLFPFSHVLSPFWSCVELWSPEEFLIKTIEDPGLIRRAAEDFLDVCIREIRQAAAMGAAGIWIEECYTDMVNPETFKTLSLPFLQALTEEIKSAGMKSVYYFAGNPAGKWDIILSAGADALAFEESKKNFKIDIDDVVERVNGQCTVLGNLDSIGILQDGTEEELRTEISRQIAAGRKNGGRFIMSTGSPVTPATPVERVRLYCDLVRELT